MSAEQIAPCRICRIVTSPLACALIVLILSALATLGLAQAARFVQRPDFGFEELSTRLLATTVTIDVQGEPLAEVLNQVSAQSGVAIEVDWPSVARLGIKPTTSVATRLRNVKLSKLLGILMESAQAKRQPVWVPARAGGDIRLADLRDERYYSQHHLYAGDLLMEIAAAGDQAANSQIRAQVIDLLQNTIEPDSWSKNGTKGGTIFFEGNALVVWHTPQVQIAVAGLLEELHDPRIAHPSPFCPAVADRTPP